MSSFGGTTTANGPSSNTEQAKEKAQEKAQQAKGQARAVRDQVDQRSTQAGERVSSTAQRHPQRRRRVAQAGQGPAGEARRAGRPARRVARRLPAALRRRHDPARHRGLRPPAAVGGHRRRRRARLRRLALPEGVELASLRGELADDHRATLTTGAPTSRTGLAPTTSCRAAATTDVADLGPASARGLRRRPACYSATAAADRAEPWPTHGPRRSDPRERGFGELVKDLASQTSTLVRQEIKLAQAEVTAEGQARRQGRRHARRRSRRRPARPRRADRVPDHRARQLRCRCGWRR